jgi:hypothetical protein
MNRAPDLLNLTLRRGDHLVVTVEDPENPDVVAPPIRLNFPGIDSVNVNDLGVTATQKHWFPPEGATFGGRATVTELPSVDALATMIFEALPPGSKPSNQKVYEAAYSLLDSLTKPRDTPAT